jgi:hypothetical protein
MGWEREMKFVSRFNQYWRFDDYVLGSSALCRLFFFTRTKLASRSLRFETKSERQGLLLMCLSAIPFELGDQ